MGLWLDLVIRGLVMLHEIDLWEGFKKEGPKAVQSSHIEGNRNFPFKHYQQKFCLTNFWQFCTNECFSTPPA